MKTRLVAIVSASLCTFALSAGVFSSSAFAQSFSNAFSGVTAPLPPPLGPPCLGVGLSIDGDIFDPGSPYSVPMGPPGCGLGWPVAGGPPFNIDAFSAGLSPAIGVAFPYGAGTFSLLFATDDFVEGDPLGFCAAGTPGPFVVTDVGAESADITVGGTTDVGADVFVTAPNGGPWGVPGAPGPGTAPNFQVFDGDGAPSIPFGLPAAAPLGLLEPGPLVDSIDAVDAAPIVAWDPTGDTLPDLPVYFSVDAATAAAVGVLPFGGPVGGSDIFVAFGGGSFIYAPAAALAMGAADDVDALIVLDVAGDGFYAPGAGDLILYSVTPGSFAIGMADCAGLLIQEGDILTEGTPLLAPGVPCIVIHEEDIGLWSTRLCGANAFGASDNLDGADLVGPAVTPPTTVPPSTTTSTTSTTITTTTSTSTTTLPAPLCGGAPLGGCKGALSGKSQLQIKLKASAPSKNQLKFKYNKGAATMETEFGDPVGGSPQFSLCVWDSSVSPQPLLEAQIGPGGTCGTKPCWKTKPGKSHQYKNKGGNADGVEQVKIKADGSPDKTKIQVKVKGSSFAAPTLPLTTTVTAQFIVDDGGTACWEVPMSVATKNDAAQFKAKGD